MGSAVTKSIIWVDNQQSLAEMVSVLTPIELLALDTEFMRTDTFFAKLALLQLSDGESIWLVDFPALSELEPLRQLLNRDDLTTLVHACGEDLEVLDSALGVVPAKLFDTQLAAAYLNQGYSLGYARLVEQLCGIELDKQATRSDWLQRPLTNAQRSYAACDVEYLHAMHRHLSHQLNLAGRLEWFDEEMVDLLATAKERLVVDGYYLKLTGAWEFSQQQLFALNRACEWRENLARQRDIPRGRIFKDPQLLDAVRSEVRSLSELRSCSEIHPGSLRKFGEQLVELLNRAYQEASASPPLAAPPRPLTRAEGTLFKQLRSVVQECAERLNVAKELLVNKRDLEHLVRQHSDAVAVENIEWPLRLRSGWRHHQLQPLLAACYAEFGPKGELPSAL